MNVRYVILIDDHEVWLDEHRKESLVAPAPVPGDSLAGLTRSHAIDCCEPEWDRPLARFTAEERRRARVYVAPESGPR
ncbi:MAG: hypothetical protein EON54_28315 [Alcaligenaceae bacterium]|nr:MAG: hypothetical protein EON54_28315 [Alcaligenaceae bacterium]